MALRVLLADESSTIKKVFQLALQDFAVEVQTVNLGIDVATVAENFQPDIIFADVLLQKKSGYEVSAEVKSHGSLGEIPVVLMWSSFMEIDEDRMEASGANARLEKPFDVKTLRKLVEGLVPKTKEQKLSDYLSFPKLPEFDETSKKPYNPDDLMQPSATKTNEFVAPATSLEASASEWSMESFDPPEMPAGEDFQEVDLKAATEEPMITASTPVVDTDQELLTYTDDEEERDWQETDIQKYKVSESTTDSHDAPHEDSDASIDYLVSDESVDAHAIMHGTGRIEEDVSLDVPSEASPELPKNIEDQDIMENLSSDIIEKDFQPQGKQRGPTVVLNFDLDGNTTTNPKGTHPDSQLRNLAAELDAEAIQKIIEDQAKQVIETAVWKILPDLATQIIEKELKRLLDDHGHDHSGPTI